MKDPKRIKAPLGVPAWFTLRGARGEGKISDLSFEGLFVHSPMLPREGEEIAVSFQVPGADEITVHGAVRWNTSTADPSVGLRSGFGVRLSRFGVDYSAFLNSLRTDEPGDA